MAHAPGITLKPLVKLPRDPSACWEWQGAIDAAGYARKQHRDRAMTAARWMWEVLWGAVPEAFTVACLHGNRTCCNPHHLVARPQAEANRSGVGATLTAQDVAVIKRAKRGRGLQTATQLATQFDVQPAAIRAIWRGATWGRRGRPGTYQRKETAAHG
ncbi:MAG TPA: HNH endonuclease [Frateuria sp.]|uniref:HNH endonuclease n=1 Tax=Frateuria sp. TaxID=2211372 RepID=UPI002D7FB040|nr:HNH endonuclease [Frateuria sp.]HET6805643.1 HNH endonuclease [Frateuria sp.]